MAKKPDLGEIAPEFKAPVVGGDYGSGETIDLERFRGENVVLYFYPKDDTPGCTKQACAIRDGWKELSKKAKVFGVSVDSVKSHEKFIEKFELPFPLISDPEHKMADRYGVWVEKSMYGKKYMGTERSTFIIGADGKIKAVLEKVAPGEHLDLVMKALKT